MKPTKRSTQYNLSSPDGVRDVQIGSATVADRRMGDLSKAGSMVKALNSAKETDDAKSRRDEYGFDYKSRRMF